MKKIQVLFHDAEIGVIIVEPIPDNQFGVLVFFIAV